MTEPRICTLEWEIKGLAEYPLLASSSADRVYLFRHSVTNKPTLLKGSDKSPVSKCMVLRAYKSAPAITGIEPVFSVCKPSTMPALKTHILCFIYEHRSKGGRLCRFSHKVKKRATANGIIA